MTMARDDDADYDEEEEELTLTDSYHGGSSSHDKK